MENEIYIIDENNQEHLLKYVDEERIIVQKVTRYERPKGSEDTGDIIQYSMPCKVWIDELHKWPYTDGLKRKITEFHAQFPDAK